MRDAGLARKGPQEDPTLEGRSAAPEQRVLACPRRGLCDRRLKLSRKCEKSLHSENGKEFTREMCVAKRISGVLPPKGCSSKPLFSDQGVTLLAKRPFPGSFLWASQLRDHLHHLPKPSQSLPDWSTLRPRLIAHPGLGFCRVKDLREVVANPRI